MTIGLPEFQGEYLHLSTLIPEWHSSADMENQPGRRATIRPLLPGTPVTSR